MDPLSFGEDSCLYLESDDGTESIPMMSRRSVIIYSGRPFQLTFSPPRPKTRSSYTVYTLRLEPVVRDELAPRLELYLFGDREKVSVLMQFGRDEDRWQALQDLIAKDVFDCADLAVRIEHPRDFSWEGGGLIRSHSYDPHFLVGGHQDTVAKLMRCKFEGHSVSAILLPKIYVSDTNGTFSEKSGIRFPALIEHTAAVRLVHVPRGTRIKVNPVSCPGTVHIASLRFEGSTVRELLTRIFTSTLAGGYREIPAIVREFLQTRAGEGQGSTRRGITGIFWLLYRRLSRALSSRELPAPSQNQDLNTWLHDFQPSPSVLESYCAEIQRLGLDTRFSVICVLNRTAEHWLDELIRSVIDQIYDNWELLLVGDWQDATSDTRIGNRADTDPRIRHVRDERTPDIRASLQVGIRQADGDYLVFAGPNDILEKHALYKCAMAIRSDAPDFLYSDECITSEDIDDFIDVTTRPAFSIDYYLSHPYFTHLVCIRRELAQLAAPFDEARQSGQEVGFNLRCLELARVVTHIPDLLYRWRTPGGSADTTEQKQLAESTLNAIKGHLSRTGRDAIVRPTRHFNVFDIRDRVAENARIAIIIPTKNNHRLLRKAVDSCTNKKGDVDIDIFIVDHESDEQETQRYLAEVGARSIATVIPYEGPFNFSAMNNMAISMLPPGITHYLFLNNDVAAISEAWIESMTATCCRADVGVCGAMLLYPDNTIQHGGVTIGFLGAAEHTYKSAPYYDAAGMPSIEHACALVARRDCMAVTAAAMMVRADVFHETGGYDEQLLVGFNDTDLCLRIFEAGYKVIFDSNVVLYHYESATRGTGATDPHPNDTQRFRNKHRIWIEKKEIFYGAQLSLASTDLAFDRNARSQFSRPRTIIQPDGCYGKRIVKL